MDGQGTAWECGNGIWIKTEQSRPKWSAVMTGVGFPGGASGNLPANAGDMRHVGLKLG